MVILRKYNTATAAGTHVRIPIPKAGSTDFATGSDWTPAAGDVKLSKDGGAQANITTLPTFSNGAWEFQLTGTELSCKQLEIMIVDAATKAIVDQCVLLATFGNASAMYQADFSAANLPANVAQWNGTNVATPDIAGYPKVTANVLRSGTAQAGAAGSITLDAGASAVDNLYNGAVILLTGGTGAGQCNGIVDYDGTTKIATVSHLWATNPDNTTTFVIVPMSVGAWFGRSTAELNEAAMPVKSGYSAVAGAVHRVRDNAGTKEVYRSNGTTLHASGAITVDPANGPIDEIGGLA